MGNAQIADRLESFATMLELAESNPYTIRAYRRAAETIRATPAPVAELVADGRIQALRGIGPGIAARLTELVSTGEIAELAELERELAPDLVGLGRYLGLSASRSMQIARTLDVHTAQELRDAAAAGRLQSVPGIGAKIEARLIAALHEPSGSRSVPGLRLNRARDLVGAIAAALGGAPAGDPRRWRDSCERLAVVVGEQDPDPVLDRFAALPQIVAIIERERRGALGVTVEGVPVELVVAPPAGFGPALIRATGSEQYVAALEPLPDGADEAVVYDKLHIPWCPPELRETAETAAPPSQGLLELAQIRGDLHSHTTWTDGRASVEEMGRAAQERGYEYLAICDHTPAVGAVHGLTPDELRRQGEEIAQANAALAPFRVLRGIECDILPDGRLDLPDDVLAGLDWVQASVHGGQRTARRELTKRVSAALEHPSVCCLSHPTGRLIGRRPENALDLDVVFELARTHGVALEVNGLPDRLDLSGEHVRRALAGGVAIVCSTDAHSVRGLDNMALAVATARRGGATTADIVNTRRLETILGFRGLY